MEDGDGKNYHNKPRCHRATPCTRTLLPGSERLATLVDGLGKRSASWRAVGDVVPSILGTLGSVESVAEDDPETRRQHVGTGRRVHPGSPQRPLSEKTACGPGPFQDDRIRRTAPVPRRRRSTKIV